MDSFTDTHCKFLEYLDYIPTDEQPYHKLKRRPQNGNRWTLIIIRAEKLLTWRTFEKHTHTHGPLSGTTRVSRYQKGKTIWILLEQETVSGSGISWTICKSAPCSRQITTPAPHHSLFYRLDALPATQPTVSKH